MVFRKTLENQRRLKKRRSNVMTYIMNINIQADEDIQYILRNIKNQIQELMFLCLIIENHS